MQLRINLLWFWRKKLPPFLVKGDRNLIYLKRKMVNSPRKMDHDEVMVLRQMLNLLEVKIGNLISEMVTQENLGLLSNLVTQLFFMLTDSSRSVFY
jgi:hypothetical protein